MSWIATAPLPWIGLALAAALLAMLEIGYRVGARIARPEGDGGGGPDLLLSAVLGLLALLLGFTFSLALNRYEARRDLVQQEANALGTLWLRADLMVEPVRTPLKAEILTYAKARLAWSATEVRGAGLAETQAEQARIWALVRTAVRTEPVGELSLALIEATNEAFDVASARASSRVVTIPPRVLQVLGLYALLSALMLGYVLGASGRLHRVAADLLLVLLTLAMALIIDLDRPLGGAIRVSQAPLEAALADMR